MENNNAIDKKWIQVAIDGAVQASGAIMEVYNRGFQVEIKSDRSPVTEADKTSSKILIQALQKTGIPIISEEESVPSFEERKDAAHIWIIDPLDGTKEFVRRNGEFCICIALIQNNQSVFGLIASPVEQKILIGSPSIGAYYFDFTTENYLNETYRVPPVLSNGQKTIAHSRSHFSERTLTIIERIRVQYGEPEFIKKGSALKFIDLTLDKAQFYPRMAPTMEWDIAAGQAIYESVGGEVLDFTNFEPLRYNKEDLYNPFFIAKHKDLTI